MFVELNENLLRNLYEEDSVTVAEIDEEETADLFPDEYCDPMAEFRMI